jgi:ComF family protein
VTSRAIANRVLARIFSPPCAACGGAVPRPLDGAVCDVCWASLPTFAPPLCVACGDPLLAWRSSSANLTRCPRCRRRPRPITRQAAVGPYEGTLRAIVHALKYDARLSVAAPLSRRMAGVGGAVLEAVDAVVPVPLHPMRRWTRGFNQAELLSSHLERPLHRLLTRVRATPPQVALPAAQRHRNVRGAFGLHHREVARLVSGKRRAGGGMCLLDGLVLVLIDDVATTGATLEACARVLLAAGAAEVRALTAARVATAPR